MHFSRLSWISRLLVFLTVSVPVVLQAAPAHGLSDMLLWLWQDHPTLRAKRSERQAAQENVTIAERQFWPTPSISNDVGPANVSGRSRSTTARLSLPVYTGGQLSADLEMADLRHRISEAEIEVAGQDLVFQFTDFYRIWWSHSLRSEILKSNLDRLEQLRQMVRRRSDSGVSARLDLTQAELQWQKAKDDLRESLRQRDHALVDMSTFVGRELNPVFEQLDKWPALPFQRLVDLQDRVMAFHPSLNISQWQLALAQAEMKKAQASLFPTVTLRVEKQFGAYQGSLEPGQRTYLNSQYSLGAGLAALPQQQLAAARAQAAEKQTAASRLALVTQIQKLWHEHLQQSEQLKNTLAQLKVQETVTRAGTQLFTAGRRSWQDLLAMQRELYQLQAQQVELESASMAALLRLHLMARTYPQFSFPSQ